MEKYSFLSPRATRIFKISLVMALSSTGHAATRIPLQQISFSKLKQLVHVAPFVKTPRVKGARAAASIDALQVISMHHDHNHVTHIRMQQEYEGFPVLGGYAILHRSDAPDGHKPTQTGAIYQGLQAELGQVPLLFVTHAEDALKQFVARYRALAVSEATVVPMVYIDEQHRAFWAYKVSVLIQPQDGIPARPTAIIDAKTQAPFISFDDVKTQRKLVKGYGFGGNKRVGKYEFGINKPWLDMNRDDLTGVCYMENTNVKVVDMVNFYEKKKGVMTFDCPISREDNSYATGYEGNGYDLLNGSYSPSNDALYIGGMVKEMYKNWYNEEVLRALHKPMQLVMRVHYGDHYENAFWDGRQMTFGDGDRMTHSLVTLSVGAHEVSHGFTEQHADLMYFGQSGGMNESFSDMASAALEFYVNSTSSWLIGADVLKKESGQIALRYMDKPSRDGSSIDTAASYHSGLDVHFSSGVYNHLFYALATQPGWDPRLAFHVMLKANSDYWTPTSTFEEGACGVINAASDLGFSVADVKNSLDVVMINYSDC